VRSLVTNMKTTMNTHPSNRALIDACLRHDAAAFGELFVRFHRAVYAGATRAIARRLAVCGTADDLTSQFFLQVMECPEGLLLGCADRSDLASWLNAVSFRQCSMILRSDVWRWPGAGPIVQNHNLNGLLAPADQKLHRLDIVSQVLELLDEASRAIIELRFGIGRCTQRRSIREIADRLGCDRRTVSRRLREAIRQLRVQVRAFQDNLDD